MGLATVMSRASLGISAPPVTVEVFLSGGLPRFNIVGLAETAVRESKDRVFGAIRNSKFEFPQSRITANLGPADMKKTGGRFDLAIALGILAAGRQLPAGPLCNYEFFGELALNGDVRPIPGILPAAIRAAGLGRAIMVPAENAEEAALAGATVYPVRTLLEVTAILRGRNKVEPQVGEAPAYSAPVGPDMADVRGQLAAKRAIEIAAAGGHNVLLVGPPGTGKSMLAARLPGLLPPLSVAEAIETASVGSVLGRAPDLARWLSRPFRAPHHTASAPALVGGGSDPRPGEISLAHNGVLFLDELAEFDRHVLEVLREPLESGRVTISRAAGQADFPASFQLVAAMNPCPCGYSGDPAAECRCSADAIRRYRDKISGPLMDRIDLHVEVGRPPVELLRPDAAPGEASAPIAERVAFARRRQLARAGKINAALSGADLEATLGADKGCFDLLGKASRELGLSARAYQRVQRVARTIADLGGSQSVERAHIAEALGFRCLDRGFTGNGSGLLAASC